MKKVLIGCFACLVAFFGCLFSVGSSTNNFAYLLDSKPKESAVLDDNSLSFYFDNNVSHYESFTLNIATLTEESSLYFINNNGDNILINDNLEGVVAFSSDGERNMFYIGMIPCIIKGATNDEDLLANIWYGLNQFEEDPIPFEVLGFVVNNVVLDDDISNINSSLDPYIGTLTSLDSDSPSEPTPPSSPSDNPLNDISSTINGVIDWFVDLFNGLSDIFVITDSSGAFVGFSLWGNLLFIQVSLGLVIIVLRWVISLVKGV